MDDAPAIRATGIDKSFGATRAVIAADVSVGHGELVALVGPSGSGKTTLLRVIAGFDAPDAGTAEVGGRVVVGPGVWEEPERRRVGMVFQDGALFPHLTVAGNIAFGHPVAGRADECLDLVGLRHRADSYPHELSGGERQRVALARALAIDPEVVLLDEPFIALDAGLRLALREEVAGILRDTGASALLVTHDQEEALSLADRIVVMREGRIEQSGPPEEVYAHPASGWVAEFLGAAELLPGTAMNGVVDSDLGRFPVDPSLDGPVEIVVRPEAIAIAAADDGAPTSAIPARVVGRTFYGHDQLVVLELPSGRRVRSRTLSSAGWTRAGEVRVWVDGPVRVRRPDTVECTP